MKKQHTSKLFFDKYVNKVVITASLATLFRERELDVVKAMVDEYANKIDLTKDKVLVVASKWHNKKFYPRDVFLASKVIDALENEDYALRVEGSRLGVYTNNPALVAQLLSIANDCIYEVSTPRTADIEKYLLANPNTIVANKKEFEYKLKLAGLGEDGAINFKDWASKMSKVKITDRKDSYKWEGGHVYVADSKTLTVCKLYLGKKIRRVDRIVLENEI